MQSIEVPAVGDDSAAHPGSDASFDQQGGFPGDTSSQRLPDAVVRGAHRQELGHVGGCRGQCDDA